MSEYCLRWNNHRPNLVTVFSELLTSEALVDVTLATDGHYIRAHKLVLSACSIYFKDLFASSPCKHPIVILKDISIEALKTVIDFIYRGEVTVSQDKLQEVLRTAESLRIKGLTDNPRSYDELPSHGLRNTSSSFSSQVSLATRQRSSLTDSRDQSLSLEGEDEGEPGTPPSSKKRKIASEHDSLESSQDNAETEENNGLGDVKPEPSEDRDNERSLSRGTESEYNMGSSLENAEEAGGAAGSSDSATPQHPQGSPLWTLPLNPWWASVLPAFSHHQRFHRPVLHPPVSRALTHPSLSLSGNHGGIGRNLGTGSPSGDLSSGIGSSGGCGRGSPRLQHQPPPPSQLAPLDKLALVAALGKEVSPQMVQALQAVAQRRESFSSAAKLYSVSVTTLWRYFKKLNLADHANAGLSQGGSRSSKISMQSKKLAKSDTISSGLTLQGLPEGVITPRVALPPPKIISPPPYESPFNANSSIFSQGGTEGESTPRVPIPPLKVESPPPYPSPTNSSPALP